MAKKLQLGYREIEQRLVDSFGSGVPASEVGYALLHSFGKSERDITRYKEGKGVLKTFDGLLIKGLFCYQSASMFTLTDQLEMLKTNATVIKAAPKIVAVSDGKTILAYDLRERDTYENRLDHLPSDFAFFYPLMDVERVHYVEESPADIKAAEKLAKLHDELRSYNEFRSNDDLHDLNIFISRLLFCFFAEDTGIFEENLFTSSIQRYTKEDGSDISDYLDWSFNIMDVSLRKADTPSIIKQFPYVNGGLFSKHIQIPKMGARARRIIIECGELNWKDINPDIFGSMIQAVVNPEERANQGMHYTSVPNIMKVINPLFLDELRGEYNQLNEEFEQLLQLKKIGGIKEKDFYARCRPISKKCEVLLVRMGKMKFFDPACGSGNFLIITYKCLRFLEMDILALQQKCLGNTQSMFVDASVITLNQFYGIELLDFPHEVAMLSLWLAEHQMNTKLNENFGVNTKALPLKNITQIVCGNACRIDWNEVCPHTPEEEVFIFGNPPYLGSRRQDESQKKDMELVFKKDFGELDYIACWFMIGAQYIKGTKAKYAFVSTNSICQGLQVALLWKRVLKNGLVINFAYKSFKWQNNAKYNAGVTCVIVGLASESIVSKRLLFDTEQCKEVKNISPLLMDAPTIFVESATMPICKWLPQMNFGNMPADGGKLILSEAEKNKLIEEEPEAERFIRPLIGAEELINGKMRWCIWLYGEDEKDYLSIPQIVKRIDELRVIREQSARPQLAAIPHLFAQITQPLGRSFIIIPSVSSENRKYIPIGYLDERFISTNLCMVVGTDDISLFGMITSHMHMVWIKTVGGKLETRYRYSAQLCYNTFPFPKISDEKKAEIEEAAENVLITREYYPEKTLAELYDPDKMPQDLREAHAKLDDIVESCYPGYPFASDEARLECLFKLYEKMTVKK
ncbi:MAG: class I SAM-dependent DNA methyltransferase [Prevotella ruminicola]|uniref:site-specific DNA-methyltransferase (adenine-specific) n=1 Tax=Xylanibacter ruminicola TaxID=839 RepID=A0A9D5P187_XYLRU|nr:class I SAM-dependent DNA methyltransferase [Xylanibacter ruminicola]